MEKVRALAFPACVDAAVFPMETEWEWQRVLGSLLAAAFGDLDVDQSR